MELLDVQIAHYRSVEDSGVFPVDPDVTCLVGKNESGKTAILQALRRLNPLEDVKFVVTEDYPRRYLQKYKERHPKGGCPGCR
jgi:predicted ATP-dependent endonuclease of OLD family